MKKSTNAQVYSSLEEAIKRFNSLKTIGCLSHIDESLRTINLRRVGKNGFRLSDNDGNIICETHNDTEDMVNMLTELLTGFIFYQDHFNKNSLFIQKK